MSKPCIFKCLGKWWCAHKLKLPLDAEVASGDSPKEAWETWFAQTAVGKLRNYNRQFVSGRIYFGPREFVDPRDDYTRCDQQAQRLGY